MLRHRFFLKIAILFLFFFISNLFAIDVLVTKNTIKFKDKISTSDLIAKKVKKVHRLCEPVKLSNLDKNIYIASRYLMKGTVLCEKDVKEHVKQTVLFDFGNLQIEKEGKVISDTKSYIKIKKPDGQVEKIYKDGRLK